jgi:hypothetical protein
MGLTMAHLYLPKDNYNGNGKHNGHGRRIAKVYSYRSGENEVVHETIRYEPKGFSQRRPDGRGGHVWNLEGISTVLYRLPELLNSAEDDPDGWVFVCEGEKDAENVAALGFIATTNVGGAGKWKPSYSDNLTRRRLVFLPHNDDAGRIHHRRAAESCNGKAHEIRILNVPGVGPKGDVSDWIAAGGTAEQLLALVEQTPAWDLSHKCDEGMAADPVQNSAQGSEPPIIAPISAGAFVDLHPEQPAYVIVGMLRLREVMNLVASPKARKSFLALMIGLCVCAGRMLLALFQTQKGRVLLIDNELFPGTITHRLKAVADALGIMSNEWRDAFDILSLRGNLHDVYQLDRIIRNLEAGKYSLIIVDALYKLYPKGFEENSNADLTWLYNQFDTWGAATGAAIIVVHHTSKGIQAEKSITDTGAGGSAQARSADTHSVVREHEQKDCAVLEASLRSSKPIDPIGMGWQYPLWRHEPTLDVTALKKTKPPTKKAKAETPEAAPVKELTLEDLRKCVADAPHTLDWVVEEARKHGFKNRAEVERLLNVAVENGDFFIWPNKDRRTKQRFSSREPMLPDLGNPKGETS